MRLYWYLNPPHGEPSSRNGQELVPYLNQPVADRSDHYAQIVRGAGLTGFDGLVAGAEGDEDSRMIANAVTRWAPHLLLVPELTASAASRVHIARQALAFERPTHERPDSTAIAHGTSTWYRRAAFAEGDFTARTEEFLRVARGLDGDPDFGFKGRFFGVEGGGFIAPLNHMLFPPIFVRGESKEALETSARAADVHLLAAAPPELFRDRIRTLDRLAREEDRRVQFGLIAKIVARETDAEAAWAGPSDLSGSYDTVAGQLASLCATGVSHIVLTSRTGVEEIYRIGRHVIPRLRARVVAHHAAARRLRA